MMVKICGITNADDALAAAAAGATALGFNFYPPSPRFIQPEAAARIIEGLPREVWKVGVFVDMLPHEIARVQRIAALDVAQLHGDEPPDQLPSGIRVWKAFRIDAAGLEAYRAEAFLLDAPSDVYGGTGRTFDWTKAVGTGRKIILAGGLDEDNVGAAIRQVRPWGVDACSRLESAPGRKDHARMARFVQAASSENCE
jgi:phosphoribosylanthranilate isomerase